MLHEGKVFDRCVRAGVAASPDWRRLYETHGSKAFWSIHGGYLRDEVADRVRWFHREVERLVDLFADSLWEDEEIIKNVKAAQRIMDGKALAEDFVFKKNRY